MPLFKLKSIFLRENCMGMLHSKMEADHGH